MTRGKKSLSVAASLLVLTVAATTTSLFASGQRHIHSSCGRAAVDVRSDSSGTICISLCGAKVAVVICEMAVSGPRLPRRDPVEGVDEIKIVLRGGDVTVEELAAAFEKVTGWRVEYDAAMAYAKLKNIRWKGTWHDLETLRMRSQGGGVLGLTMDEPAHAFRLGAQS